MFADLSIYNEKLECLLCDWSLQDLKPLTQVCGHPLAAAVLASDDIDTLECVLRSPIV